VRGRLTDEEVVRRTGVATEQIAEWERLELLRREDDGTLDAESLERVRLLRYVTKRGVAAEDVARRAPLERYVDLLGGPRPPGCTPEEAAERVGLDPALVRHLRVCIGQGAQEEVFEEDVDMLRGVKLAKDAGLPDEAILQLARTLADSLGRAADAESRIFHFYVHEPLRASLADEAEAMAVANELGDSLLEMMEPAVLYFHRKAWQRALREDVVLHLAADVARPGDAVGQLPVAVLFVDLAGFTPLTESMGDAAAADVLARFSHLVRDSASRWEGRVVKQIGDEFMLVFPDAAGALECGLDIVSTVAREPRFPAVRMGAHAGHALYREADYFGSTVNVAARVTARAERGAFLVTERVRRACVDRPSLAWISLGAHDLKGVSEAVVLHEVRAADAPVARPVDPVCGMLLGTDEHDVELRWEGEAVRFCSTACRDRFLSDPEAYAVG
jgi:adenylate cyclase